MSFQMFHELCPEVGLRETRTVALPANSDLGLPADNYAFLEMYCSEAGCDCRRVYFQVIAMSNPSVVLAVITWGWEPLAFYRRWGHYPGAEKDAKDMKGPALALLTKQSALAPAIRQPFAVRPLSAISSRSWGQSISRRPWGLRLCS